MRVRQAVQVPRGDIVTWRADAVCREIGVDVFFPEFDDEGIGQIRKICADCPVRALCLDEAVSMPHYADWGFWGGTTRAERHRMRRAA